MSTVRGLEFEAALTKEIIAACYEVHNVLGPGLEEKFYRDALVCKSAAYWLGIPQTTLPKIP